MYVRELPVWVESGLRTIADRGAQISDDGQLNLPSGGHAELPGGGHLGYSL
jgi:hypothetical protein